MARFLACQIPFEKASLGNREREREADRQTGREREREVF